jgi:hypothetical protein
MVKINSVTHIKNEDMNFKTSSSEANMTHAFVSLCTCTKLKQKRRYNYGYFN